jgi:hypothetical protein
LTPQKAHTITGALVKLGVIEIVCKGKAGLNGGEAAEFRYLLPQNENRADEEDEEELVIWTLTDSRARVSRYKNSRAGFLRVRRRLRRRCLRGRPARERQESGL